jgi:transcriptional regulatory protein RtcR
VHGSNVTFNKEARERFLSFATGTGGMWRRNFRDLNAAISRMATLAGGAGARITTEVVEEEIAQLRASWRTMSAAEGGGVLRKYLKPEAVEALDRFDAVQLEEVLKVCEAARTLSEAGRALFASSRKRKKVANDADRLRKYLSRFGLEWGEIKGCSLLG